MNTCWKCGKSCNEGEVECLSCCLMPLGMLGSLFAAMDAVNLILLELNKFGQAKRDLHDALMDATNEVVAENRRIAKIIRQMPQPIRRHPPIKPSRK